MAEAHPDKERTFLGLTHNPFVEPQRGFFDRGGRKTHLEQLRHLSEWSRRVLLVTGAEGVGKTTLYRELAATLEPRVKAARINGSLVNTGFEVLSAIAQGFGLAIPTDANTQSLRMDLVEHVEAQTEADRLCLALVDDAHLLDHKAVDSMVAIAHDCGLHLMCFGEVRMVPVIERAASAKGVGWQEIRLSGYGEADARDYLEWRFGQAKYRGRIPFTDNQVRDLVKLSEGLPGRINQMANVLLVKLETGEGTAPSSGFPRAHTALLTLLIVAVGFMYLVVGNDGADEPAEQDGDPIAGERLADAGKTSESKDVAADSEPSSAGVPVAVETTGEQETPDERSDEQPVADPVDERTQMSAAETEVPAIEGEAASTAEIDTPAADPDVTVPAMPAEERAGASEVTTETPAQPPVEQAPAAVVDLPQGAKDTRWLLAQDPAYFTLQLVTVSSPERASAFVARQQEPGEFTVYQLQRDGRILHVVLFGLFSSRTAAETAADNLPPEVGRVQPWIRPLAQVQDAARLSTRQ